MAKPGLGPRSYKDRSNKKTNKAIKQAEASGDYSSLEQFAMGLARGLADAERRGRTGGTVKKRGKQHSKAIGALEEAGIDTSGYDEASDFEGEFLDVNEARRFYKHENPRTGGRSTINKALAQEQNRQFTAEDDKADSQAYYDENTQPLMDEVGGQIQELLQSPTFDAGELAAMRTSITDQVRGAEEDRLRRVNAVLGVRGLDPGSPAGAAMAEQVAEETDNFLIETLRKHGLEIAQLEEMNQLKELQLGQRHALAGIQARNAALEGDKNRLFAAQSDLAGLFAALSAQKRQQILEGKLLSESRDRDFTESAAGFVGLGADIFSLVNGLPSMGSTMKAPSTAATSAASSGAPSSSGINNSPMQIGRTS